MLVNSTFNTWCPSHCRLYHTDRDGDPEGHRPPMARASHRSTGLRNDCDTNRSPEAEAT